MLNKPNKAGIIPIKTNGTNPTKQSISEIKTPVNEEIFPDGIGLFLVLSIRASVFLS